MNTKLTMQQAAQKALDMQDACNLSGVVYGFIPVMEAICEESRRLGKGTGWKNTHPLVRLYADKLSQLANADSTAGDLGLEAYKEALRLAAGGEVGVPAAEVRRRIKLGTNRGIW
jgi:hypothetical protein